MPAGTTAAAPPRPGHQPASGQPAGLHERLERAPLKLRQGPLAERHVPEAHRVEHRQEQQGTACQRTADAEAPREGLPPQERPRATDHASRAK